MGGKNLYPDFFLYLGAFVRFERLAVFYPFYPAALAYLDPCAPDGIGGSVFDVDIVALDGVGFEHALFARAGGDGNAENIKIKGFIGACLDQKIRAAYLVYRARIL